MGWAGEYAVFFRSLWGIRGVVTDDQVDGILDDLGIRWELVSWLPGDLPEILIGSRLQILASPDRRQIRYSKLHILPHVGMHNGSQFTLDKGYVYKQEYQCDDFVARFVTDTIPLEWRGTEHLIAEYLELPGEYVRRAWPIIRSLWV